MVAALSAVGVALAGPAHAATRGIAVVVCALRDRSDADVEVVYLDDRDRAIKEGVIWNGTRWEFSREGPCGGYADQYDHLHEFVTILRAGRPLHGG